MIPLRDINPTRSTPVLTYTIIALNVLVYAYQVSLGDVGSELFVRRYGLIPAYLTAGHVGSLITPFASMFMHGGLLHIVMNMWSLYIFGDNVEDALGKPKFLAFYLLSGVGAAFGQVAVDPHSLVPAWIFILIWFGFQVLSGLDVLQGASSGGVAVFAHIGGFLAGMLLVTRMASRRNDSRGFRTPGRHGY